MSWMKDHRSERPAIWDYSNPRAERRISLRQRLAVSEPPKKQVKELALSAPPRKKVERRAAKPPRKGRKKK